MVDTVRTVLIRISHFIRRSLPSKVTSYSTRRRTSLTSRYKSPIVNLVFSDTLETGKSALRHRGRFRDSYPSNTSSTPLRTLSPTSFQPTCSIHQLNVRYFLSVSSLTDSASSRLSTASPSSKVLSPQNNECIDVSNRSRSRARSSRSN